MGPEAVQAGCALGLGVLGLLAAALAPEGAAPRRADLLGGAAVAVLLLAAAAVSLLREPPFSTGQALAPALLLGGLGVAGAHLLISRLPEDRPLLQGAAGMGAAAVAVSGLLFLHPRGNLEACSGLAIGALLAGMAICAVDPGRAHVTLAVVTPAFAATAAATLLAVYHLAPQGGSPAAREWMPHPALMAGAGSASLAVAALARRGPGSSAVLVAAPVLLVAGLVGSRMNAGPAFMPILLGGYVAVLAVDLLLGATGQATDAERSALRSLPAGFVAVLMGLGGVVLAFRGLHGYGVALWGLGGVLALAARPGSSAAGGIAWLALLPALHRVYYERVSYTFDPDSFYLLVSLAAGLLVPFLLGGCGRGVAETLVVGAWALAAPLLARVLVGDAGQAALVAGLVLAGVAAPAIGAPVAGRSGTRSGHAPGLVAALGVLSAVQFTHLLEPLDLSTRSERVGILAGAAILAMLSQLLLARCSRSAPEEEQG